MTQTYRITLLPGDGIGPEIMAVAVDVLEVVAKQEDLNFEFTTALIGGAAIEATGAPLPAATLVSCKESDGVLLAAIGGYQWDNLPRHLRPETGLLGLRAGLGQHYRQLGLHQHVVDHLVVGMPVTRLRH